MRKTIIILLMGMVAGMATCNLLQKPKRSAVSTGINDYIPTVKIKKELQKEETKYQQEKKLLNKQILSLQDAYQLISQKITVVKKENKQLRQQVVKTIHLLQDKRDTVSYIKHCDSLQQQVVLLSAGYSQQDTLTEKEVSNLQQQLAVKDQTINSMDRRMETVNNWLHKSLAQNKMLEKEITWVKKKSKRQRFKSTLKTIGITAAAFWLGRNL